MPKLLSDKRQRWAQERGGAVFKGRRLAVPLSAAAEYRAGMQALIARMVADYRRVLSGSPVTSDESATEALMRQMIALGERWGDVFGDEAAALFARFFDRVDSFTMTNLSASLREVSGGIDLRFPHMSDALRARMDALTAENVGLIRSIPSQFHDKITGAVTRSLASGGSVFDAIDSLGAVTAERAAFIAIDQTRKVTSALNIERMKEAGIKQVEWIHSAGSSQPRPLHVEYDGRIFDLADPPVIDERTGERGWGGQLINCRCSTRPVVDFTRFLETPDG